MRSTIALFGAVWFLAWSSCASAQPEPLQLGLVPNISPRVLFEHNRPLRLYLERRLGRPVELVTAPDFRVFHQRTLAGAYDLAVTPAHMARLAQLDAGHVPLVSYAPGIACLVVTAKESGVNGIGDLRGRAITLANPLSLVALHGQQWLGAHGLRAEQDYRITRVRADDSAASMLVRGESAAALLSAGELRAIPEKLRERVAVLSPCGEVQSFVAVASARLPAQLRESLRGALIAFPAAPEFADFSAATGFKGMAAVDDAMLRTLDVLAPATRRLLDGN